MASQKENIHAASHIMGVVVMKTGGKNMCVPMMRSRI